jgi:hypothetical protein
VMVQPVTPAAAQTRSLQHVRVALSCHGLRAK